jgi:RNA polymerase sigma factor (sigma-70 family)
MQQASVPEKGEAYRSYFGLFLDAISHLARQGFVAQPADVDDLIHDFFLEVWDGLVERFDASKSGFPAYAYGAFLRFARKRILQWQRWGQPREDIAWLADQIALRPSASPLEGLVRSEEIEAVRSALRQLDPEPRQLLLEFLALGRRSERRLARIRQLNRNHVHDLLIKAFGEMVACIGDSVAWSAADRQLAYLLWCEGLTIKQVAARLRQPLSEVRESRDRLRKLLAAGLAERSPSPTRPARPVTPPRSPPDRSSPSPNK